MARTKVCHGGIDGDGSLDRSLLDSAGGSPTRPCQLGRGALRGPGVNRNRFAGINRWRLANINELESLVDCSEARPALPSNHPFISLQEGVLVRYDQLFRNRLGMGSLSGQRGLRVGHKPGKSFYVWAVCDVDEV